MNDIERAIGRLEGKFDGMMEFEEREHGKLDRQIDSINGRLETLNTWKLKVVYTSAGALLVGWALGKPINAVLDKLIALFL